MSWVHGSMTYRGEPVQVRKMTGVRRGEGWEAKIVLSDAEIVTTKLHPTPELAERALLDSIHLFDSLVL